MWFSDITALWFQLKKKNILFREQEVSQRWKEVYCVTMSFHSRTIWFIYLFYTALYNVTLQALREVYWQFKWNSLPKIYPYGLISHTDSFVFPRVKSDQECYTWTRVAQSSLSSLERVQKHLREHVGDELFSNLQPISYRRNVESLSQFLHQMFT